jgi:hypothetical protein
MGEERRNGRDGVAPAPPPGTSEVSMWGNSRGGAAAVVAVVVIAIVASVMLQSDAQRVESVLHSPPPLRDPRLHIPNFVDRPAVVDKIASAASSEDTYVIVEGGNGVGKSTAVLAALNRLSSARPVLVHTCLETDASESLLRALFRLGDSTTTENNTGGGLVATVDAHARVGPLLLSRTIARLGGPPPPLLVLEAAERLSVPVLKGCLDFAKELADARLGTFIFVFSPSSDKFPAIKGFGSMSRAHIVDVGDLSEGESIELLTRPAPPGGANCSMERAEELVSVMRGHLPYLKSPLSRAFCAGAAATTTHEDVERALFEGISASVYAVDTSPHEGGAACRTLCVVAHARIIPGLPSPATLAALLSEHLIHASLLLKRHVLTTAAIRRFVDLNCGCETMFSRGEKDSSSFALAAGS